MDLSWLLVPFLYFPPLLLTLCEPNLKKRVWLANPLITGFSAFTLATLLYWFMPYIWFFFYALVFIALQNYALNKGFDPVSALLLAVYTAFAVSELYEIPIHLHSWTTWETLGIGLTFSVWAFLAVPLFYHRILKVGAWRPSNAWLYGLAAVIVTGSIFYSFIQDGALLASFAGRPLFVELLKLYRVSWVLLFAAAIRPGPKTTLKIKHIVYMQVMLNRIYYATRK